MKGKWLNYLKTLLLWAAVLLVAGLLADWWRRPQVPEGAAALPVPTAANMSLQQWSQQQTGVLYFWGTWCSVCAYTSPALSDLAAEGVPVLGVAVSSGSSGDVQQYLADKGLRFASVADGGEWAGAWQIKAVPTVVLLKNGEVVHSTSGLASYWGLKIRIWLADRLG